MNVDDAWIAYVAQEQRKVTPQEAFKAGWEAHADETSIELENLKEQLRDQGRED